MTNVVPFEGRKYPINDNSGNGNGDGGDMNIEKRVENLEKNVEQIEARLSSIEVLLVKIDAKLDSKASAIELAEIKGKISQIPNSWQMITMILGSQITLFGLFFAIIKFGIK